MSLARAPTGIFAMPRCWPNCGRRPPIIACGTADIETGTRTLQSATTFYRAMTVPINNAVYDANYDKCRLPTSTKVTPGRCRDVLGKLLHKGATQCEL